MAFLTDEAFAYLERAFQRGRLAHAYLVSGPPGSGKEALTLRLLHLVNGIEAPSLSAVRDPLTRVIRPESKSRRIRVEQLRALEESLHLAGPRDRYKIGILQEADRLVPQAENAFLKTLEEPPPRTLLLLLTAHPEQLLETILSRCIRITLRRPGAALDLSPEGETLVETLAARFTESGPSLGTALALSRAFAGLVRQVRARLQEDYQELLKGDTAKYGQTTEGDWLKQREESYKALAESEALRHRTDLVQVLLAFFGDALRHQAQRPPVLDLPACRESTLAVAARHSTADLLRRIEAVEALRGHLETTANEGLVLDAGFVRAFS